MNENRTPTPIDERANRFVDELAVLAPTLATYVGIPGHDHRLPDFSPEGHAARIELVRGFLADLERLEPLDDVDRVTLSAARERHGLEVELYEAGEWRRDLNNITSPAQEVRDIFDLMPTDTREDWEAIASRMAALPGALRSYASSLREGLQRGEIPAARQILAVIKQSDQNADRDSSSFTVLARQAAVRPEPLPAALLAEVDAGAEHARDAFAEFAHFLTTELAPDASEVDAVGRERYQLHSRYFLGATVDLEETYEWGLEELALITAAQQETAHELYGAEVSVEEAKARLTADPARQLHGTEALREWMQATADEAIHGLADVHFDIPEPVRTIECCIAPTQTGGIYYTGPSDDFSRPGRMWWSVPAGETKFATWYEKTTVYHEGVPGHHLQIAQTVYRKSLLNSWRRLLSSSSGHMEGWALYAERLMEELGYLSEPGDRMGLLDAQRLRAARVALDIGLHLQLPLPEHLGSGVWDAQSAWPFLRSNVSGADKVLRFELDRYLGWPGQAPSYKVGERLWLRIRAAAKAATAPGETFSLKDFHRRALDLGSLGLDTLAEALRP